jgi:hypothetical protein
MRAASLGILLLVGIVAAVSGIDARRAMAQFGGDGPSRGHDRPQRPDARFSRRPPIAPQPTVQGYWFQRPYPYHLDFYRQAYGGSYEPYFGFLYGTPSVYAPTNLVSPIGPAFDIYGPSQPPAYDAPGPADAPPAP